MTASGEHHRAAIVLTVVGVVVIVVGIVGLGTIGFWYGTDMGWTGSGSLIVESRASILAAALVAVAAVVLGVVVLRVRRDVATRRRSTGAAVVLGVLMVACVWFGVRAYPQVEQATLIAIGDDGTVRWRTRLPVTDVLGLRRATTETITIEGQADRRGCDWRLRSVTLDRSTGRILETTPLPTSYGDPSEVPPPPTPIEAERGGFEVVPGSAPFICRS